MDVIQNLFRTVMFFLDNIIYSIIPIIYKLFIYLSEINLFTGDGDDPFHAIVNRVYVLLGIFMLFKVSFSLIQYLIDPNSFSDKSKGFGKLVTNAIVTMVLLVAVPWIFTFAMDLQNKIVTSNAIGQLIFGNDTGDTNGEITKEKVEEMATDVQFLMFGAFFSVNGDAIPECKDTPIFGTVDMAKNKNGCLDKLKAEFENTNNDMASHKAVLQDFFKTSDDPTGKNRNFSKFDALLWWEINDTYAINYLPFISTAAGIYIVLLLITFSIDIALRAIKLCFLQMVAPIAIVSYIDPKESISNSKMRNWINESLKTYFSLFLRIAVLFLVMVLVSAISSSVLAEGGAVSGQINDNEYNIWIYLFLILGAFMFAKQVPQMIESIFGIKMSGEMSLNPFKSMKENILNTPLATGVAMGTAAVGGFALGGIGNTVANLAKNKDLREKLAQGKIDQATFDQQYRKRLNLVGSAFGGAFSGMARSGKRGMKDKNPISAMTQGVMASSNVRRSRAAGYGFVQNARDRFTDIAGIETDYGTTDQVKSAIKDAQERLSNAKLREHQMSEAMARYAGQDTQTQVSLLKAFDEDTDGNLKFNNYNEFLASQIRQYNNETYNQLYEDVMNNDRLNDEQRENELQALVSNINMSEANGIATQDQYKQYEALRNARNEADEAGKALEKEISRLEETKGYRSKIEKK